jgi:branched-chain amino acid transport system substrate-binding protein
MLSARRTLIAFALCATVAACGGRLTNAQVLAANGVSPTATSEMPSGGGSVVGAPTASGVGAVTGVGGTATVVGGDATRAPSSGSTPSSGPVSGGSTSAAASGASPGPAGSAPAGAVGTPSQTGPIIIGSVGDYSGPPGAAQAGIPKAVQIWAASVNAGGGLFGRRVQVIVDDDGGDPATYASDVEDLVENRHVIAFVGQGAVLSMQGGAAYLEKAGIPVIGDECGNPEWYTSSDFFPQCAGLQAAVPVELRIAAQLSHQTKFAYLYCLETAACTTQAPYLGKYAPQAGLHVVYSAEISLEQIDFTANCEAAQSAGAGLVEVVGDPDTLARVAQSCARQGYHPLFLAASVEATSSLITEPDLGNVLAEPFTMPFAGIATPAYQQFETTMTQYGDSQPGPGESLGWAAAKLFELAATKAAAASHVLTPESLTVAMHTISNETLGGMTTALNFTGNLPAPQSCVFAMQGNGKGQWTAPLGPNAIC